MLEGVFLDVIVHSIQSVLSILIMVAIGIVLAKHNWFDENGSKLIANLVTKVSLPCLVLLNITNNFDHSNFFVLLHELTLPVCSVIICYFLGAFFCWVLKVPKGRRAIFKTMFFVSNCMYIGLPINKALFGEASTVYALEYFVPNTIALWAVAVYQFAQEGDGGDGQVGFVQTVKKILVSPLLGLLAAIVIILLGLKIPSFAKASLGYISSMTTPLSMIFIGIALSKSNLIDFKVNLEMFVALFGRAVLSPATMFVLHLFLPAETLRFDVLVIQSATPVAVALPVIASTYGLDVKYAAVLTSISTILFMFLVPVYMWILSIYALN